MGLSRNIVSDKNMGLSQTMRKPNDNIMGISKNIRVFNVIEWEHGDTMGSKNVRYSGDQRNVYGRY